MRLDVETSPGHATSRSGRATSVDENALGGRLDDPRPHRKRLGKGRIASDVADQPKRSAVGRAPFEERGLELQRTGGEADDAHGNVVSTVVHAREPAIRNPRVKSGHDARPLVACSGDWDSDAVATRRYLSREDHRKDEIRRVDAPIIVPALRNDDRLVLRAEGLVHVLVERFAACTARWPLRHRRR